MFKNPPTAFQRYAVAVGVVVVAFGLRYGIYGTLDHRLPFSFFTTATLVAAWYGGLGPGLLPPHQSDSGTLGEAERTAIASYAITNTLIVVLFWRPHSRLRDLEDRLAKAKDEAI